MPPTPSPRASMRPAASWPGTMGNETAGPKPPCCRKWSEPQTPQASMRTRTSPLPGCGMGRLARRNGMGGPALVHQEATGDVDRRPGDVTGVVGGQEDHWPGQLLGLGHIAERRLLLHGL